MQAHVSHPLLATFNREHGWTYYPLGLLKLVADLSGFVGPIVLNDFVSREHWQASLPLASSRAAG
jgi:hypothetical protein